MPKFLAVMAVFVVLVTGVSGAVYAGEAKVVSAQIEPIGGDDYRVIATVRHDDAGWDHYADAFDVVGPEGEVLGTRTLAHPHENEQPFTRSLSRVTIPPGLRQVRLRAHDKVHGYGSAVVTLKVPR